MGRKPAGESTTTARPRPEPVTLAVVIQVRAPPGRVRPRLDRAGRPRAPAREALVHERRLRARAEGVHAVRAARPLRGGPRPRRLDDEPAARARAPPPARARRGPARARSCR